MFPKRIYRYEVPGKYDFAPFGTELVRLSNKVYGKAILYLQCSHDNEHPNWIAYHEIETPLIDESQAARNRGA